MMAVPHAAATAALVSALLAGAGAWTAQEWRWQASNAAADKARAQAEKTAREQREADARAQRETADQLAGEHAANLAGLNTQLEGAHARIATLSDRRCLDAGTVGLLNAIGKPAPGLGLRAPAGDAAGAPPAAARPADDAAAVYASERDAAGHIALCRASYSAVSDQLNKILDIEEGRDARRR